MKRLAAGLARLYPRQWRVRYGKEFGALLEDANLTWRDLLDVIIGALRMQMKAWNTARDLKGENGTMNNQTSVPRIIEWKDRDVPHGYEFELTVEYARREGNKTLVRQFYREVDLGDSYVRINHLSRNSAAAQTFIVYGTKGEITDDFRTDRTEMVVLQADGTARHSEQTVKTWMKYEDILEKVRSGLKAGLSLEQIQQRSGFTERA